MSEAGVSERLAIARAWVGKHGLRTGLEIGFNFVGPFLIYNFGHKSLGDVRALLAASGPPIAWSIVELVRKRHLDAVSVLVLAGIALSILAFLGGGGAKFLQLRESLVGGLIGLIFVGSAAVRRPLIYELARASMRRRSQAEAAEFEARRDNPHFRRAMTVITLVWGFGMLAHTALSCILVFTLTIHDFLLVSPVVGYGVVGLLALWTYAYGRRRRRIAAAREAVEASADGRPSSPVEG